MGKAGGYAIQGHAAAFVRFLSGSYSGVVGLPLFETAQLLRGQGWLRRERHAACSPGEVRVAAVRIGADRLRDLAPRPAGRRG